MKSGKFRDNTNRLIRAALHRHTKLRRAKAFERAMREMAADPQIQAECQAIAREFAQFDLDGSSLG
jgi:hypothetical protein